MREGGKVNWPELPEEFAHAQRQESAGRAAESQRLRELAEKREREQLAAAENAERERLEKLYGAELDRATPAGIKALIRESFSDSEAKFLIKHLGGEKPIGGTRTKLLREIAKRHDEAVA